MVIGIMRSSHGASGELQPRSPDFGPVTIGRVRDTTIILKNLSSTALTGTLTVSGGVAVTLVGSEAYDLAAGQSDTFTVRFEPQIPEHVACTITTSSTGGEWLYVFKPDVGGQIIYVKLVLREDCVVVSFHEDEGGGHEEDE